MAGAGRSKQQQQLVTRKQLRGILGLVAMVTTVVAGTALDWLQLPVPTPRLPPPKQGSKDEDEESSSSSKTTKQVVVIKREPTATPATLNPLVPSSTDLLSSHHGAFYTSYNTRLRNPNWSCVRLTSSDAVASSEESAAASRTKSRFKEDSAIPQLFRTRPEDFAKSGLDRGHLTAAADLAPLGSQAALDESFLMSNISPQVGIGMNRHFWQMLEHFCRSLTKRYTDVLVCSGPLFVPEYHADNKTWRVQYEVIGPRHDIAVPTHFFKCVHASSSTGGASQACFVVPNRAVDWKQEPLESFIVPKQDVERLAGFEMFQCGGEAASSSSSSPRMLCDEVKCQLAKDAVYG